MTEGHTTPYRLMMGQESKQINPYLNKDNEMETNSDGRNEYSAAKLRYRETYFEGPKAIKL